MERVILNNYNQFYNWFQCLQFINTAGGSLAVRHKIYLHFACAMIVIQIHNFCSHLRFTPPNHGMIKGRMMTSSISYTVFSIQLDTMKVSEGIFSIFRAQWEFSQYECRIQFNLHRDAFNHCELWLVFAIQFTSPQHNSHLRLIPRVDQKKWERNCLCILNKLWIHIIFFFQTKDNVLELVFRTRPHFAPT